MQSIEKSSVFAFGGVGFAGKTSQGEVDFRAIDSQPAAVALENFKRVYAGGDVAAKSYALVGIRQLDGKRFNELLQSLQDSPEKVLTMQGCILERRNLLDVARSIASGSYDGYLKSR